MRTVWIVNHYAQVPGGVGGTRHYQLAQGLVCSGWKACILAGSTEFNTGKQRLKPGEHARLDVVDGIPFLWLFAPSYKGNGVGRILNMLSFAFGLLNPRPLRLLPQPDLIIGSSVHPFAVWSAYRLARRYRVPFVFEVRDLWPQTLIDFGLLRQDGIPAMLLRRLEGYLYRKANAIITLLPYAYRYIERFAIEKRRIRWIPNGVDLSRWKFTESTFDPPRNFLTLMYFGSLGQANGLEILLLAMRELAERSDAPRVRLRLIGDGPMKSSLESMACELSLSNVVFEDPVAKANIPLLASEADCFIAILKNSPLYQYGISLNKIYDYMAAGRPVIFASGAANNPIADAKAGITVAPGDVSSLASAIACMARMHPDDRLLMGRAGRAYVELHHNSLHLSKKLADVMNACI